MSETALGQQLFDAHLALEEKHSQVNHALCRILGSCLQDGEYAPFSEWGADALDRSLTLSGLQAECVPTPEQLQELWELGFTQARFQYGDGQESVYRQDQETGDNFHD